MRTELNHFDLALQFIFLTSLECRTLCIELRRNDERVSEHFSLTEDTSYLLILKTLQALSFSTMKRECLLI